MSYYKFSYIRRSVIAQEPHAVLRRTQGIVSDRFEFRRLHSLLICEKIISLLSADISRLSGR